MRWRPSSRTSGLRVEFAAHCLAQNEHLPLTAVMRINCVCGLVVQGDDDDELWENAQQHISADHPDLVGKVSREDIVAQAELT
jgi:hypothetical protein